MRRVFQVINTQRMLSLGCKYSEILAFLLMSADGARQTQTQGVELWRSHVTHCCSTYPEFILCCLHSEFILSFYSQRCFSPWETCFPFPFPLLPSSLIPTAPYSALCPSEVSRPLTSSFTVYGHKLNQMLPIYRKKPQFKKKQEFSYTTCKLYSQLCIAHAGFSPSTINIFISTNLTRLESIHACVQDALEQQGSLSDLCRTAKILWVLSSLDLFS